MSHFAKVEDGLVTEVIVAEQGFVDAQEGTWVQTSYNTHGGVHSNSETPLRKNYAGIGVVYDSSLDAFYEPQPYRSWTLNLEICYWEPPIAEPDDARSWDEEAHQADNSAGWVVVS